MLRIVSLVASVLLVVFFAIPAGAQSPGECTGGLCGTPNESGGGCGCGCGSILINNTDLGDTYQYADDFDEDGIEDDFDNCPFVANRDQADGDGDGIGGACDNCANVPNEDQMNTDGDEAGDACDLDIDGDGIRNDLDNCKEVQNPTQTDTDGNNQGDACDRDIDGDGVDNIEDNCPFVFNPDQLDTDPDIHGDECDSDLDDDGVQDFDDNCPLVYNPNQLDTDLDSMGDLCDHDSDDDGILNKLDNCPQLPNPDQVDEDRDRVGDVCDSRFCYVVDSLENCLDPTGTFQIYGGGDRIVRPGERVPLLMWANRKNRAIRYEWTIESRPSGSSAAISHARGSTSWSSPYNYHYKEGRRVEFTPDAKGAYVIKLTATLIFDDDLYTGPGSKTSSSTFTLTADGEPMGGGCATTSGSTSGVGVVGLLLGLLGLCLRRR